MQQFDREKHVTLYVRCLGDQLSLMESFFFNNNSDYLVYRSRISCFYQVMAKINAKLDTYGHDKMPMVHIHDVHGNC